MSDEERSLRGRVEILRGHAIVMADPAAVPAVVEESSGGVDGARERLRSAFDLSELQADAVLALQLLRFAPDQRQRIVEDLAEAEQLLRDLDR